MSDLRDRIAAVLARDAFGLTTKSATYRQADAIIAELNLTEQTRGPVTAYSDGRFHADTTIRRWVTDWRSDV